MHHCVLFLVFTFFFVDRPLPDNAFLIPRWGGVLIKNLPKAPDGHYILDKQKLHSTMRIFVSQLRSLIGIHEHDSLEVGSFWLCLYNIIKLSSLDIRHKHYIFNITTHGDHFIGEG